MNKCEKCGFLHYRTDPCRQPKEPHITAGPRAPDTGVAGTKPASRGPGEENGAPKSKRGRPRIYDDRKAYRAKWMREWRARRKAQKEEQK